MTGATRKERRDQFSEEHFDTEDRMDRVITGIGAVVLVMAVLGVVRFVWW